MNKELLYSFCMLLAAGFFCACQTESQTPGPALLSVPATSVSVPSDAALESDPFEEVTLPVTDTVWVSSSRSWTAFLETSDGGNWVKTNVQERINVTGQMEKYPVVVSFDRYRGSQPRTATLTFFGVDIETPVVVTYTQEAFVPSLVVSAPQDNTLVPAQTGECVALIRSNTTWSVSIDTDASTVIPGLSANSGSDSKAITLSFPANVDDEKAKIARLVVKAAGCPDQSLDFIQTQSDRYFLLASPVPQILEPFERELQIPLRSNGPWSAEIKDCTFENARLQPAAGNVSLSGFTFLADHGADPELLEKHATIVISREGMEPITVSFSQRGSIHLSFISFDPEYEYNGSDPYGMDNPYKPYKTNGVVFSYPVSFPGNYSQGTFKEQVVECETARGSYIFTVYGQDCGAWLSSNELGFCVGKRKGDYILFPNVEGCRLSGMYYEASCKAVTPYTVRTEDGEIIKGGERSVTKQVYPIASEHHDMHVHTFPETMAGERYGLILEEDLRFISIKDLCLVYEK